LTTAEGRSHAREKDLQRIRMFRLLDDDFMTKCFEGDPACAELVLRIILEKPDLHVTEVHTQVFLANLVKRSVRLDVLAMDSTGRKYDIEIQRDDRGAGQRRARFNSSMMDAKWTEKGTDFEDIPDTYIIFITESDVLGRGRPVSHIERCIVEDNQLFDDGAHILYVNGAYRGDSPIGRLMHDFSCTDAAEMHYQALADRVRFFKESKEGTAIMCKLMEEMCAESYQQGEQIGIQKGEWKNAIETARRMLADGELLPEEIAAYSGLSLEKVLSLRQESTFLACTDDADCLDDSSEEDLLSHDRQKSFAAFQ